MSNPAVRFQASDLIRVEDDAAVRVITLANPARRNALSSAMILALSEALALCAADFPKIRCVVLAGDGPAFCAGHDLKEIQAARPEADKGRARFKVLMNACSTLMLAIRDLPMPVIAAVEGVATAAGCQLVASCDLAIAGTGARFATPGVNIGLFCSTPMVALSRNISNKHAMEMLLTGEMIDAETAFRFGLVNRVVETGTALAAALELGTLVASKPALTLKIGKEAFYRQQKMGLDEAYSYASRVMVENMLAGVAEEGIGAFTSRRGSATIGRG